jgi:hypothetical protein
MFKAKSRVEGERLSVGCYPVLITRVATHLVCPGFSRNRICDRLEIRARAIYDFLVGSTARTSGQLAHLIQLLICG